MKLRVTAVMRIIRCCCRCWRAAASRTHGEKLISFRFLFIYLLFSSARSPRSRVFLDTVYFPSEWYHEMVVRCCSVWLAFKCTMQILYYNLLPPQIGANTCAVIVLCNMNGESSYCLFPHRGYVCQVPKTKLIIMPSAEALNSYLHSRSVSEMLCWWVWCHPIIQICCKCTRLQAR